MSQKPKGRRPPQTPSTADEWLASGVETEEAGEKWRAGDAAKSTRFFDRAIEIYDRGLSIYPDSFDLAYNKARIQFQITQYPKLLAEVPQTYVQLLQKSLVSHRYALNLSPDDSDCLFNTAQILTLLAETKDQGKEDGREGPINGRDLLEEALQLQQKCYAIQSRRLQESEQFHADLQADSTRNAENEGGVSLDNTDEKESQSNADVTTTDEAWATIEEPVTMDTLIDTAIAMLETLLALSEHVEEGHDLRELEELGSKIVNGEVEAAFLGLRSYEQGIRTDAILANARLRAGLLEAGFRTMYIALQTAREGIMAAFEEVAGFGNPPLSDSPAFLNAYADALVNFELNIAERQPTVKIQWDILNRALDIRTKASKAPNAEHLSLIHAGRGDIELRRLQLSFSEDLSDTLRSSSTQATLLKNAGVYYRAASAFARKEEATTSVEENRNVFIKEALIACIDTDSVAPLADLVQKHQASPPQIASTIETAHAELLFDSETAQSLRLAVSSEFRPHS